MKNKGGTKKQSTTVIHKPTLQQALELKPWDSEITQANVYVKAPDYKWKKGLILILGPNKDCLCVNYHWTMFSPQSFLLVIFQWKYTKKGFLKLIKTFIHNNEWYGSEPLLIFFFGAVTEMNLGRCSVWTCGKVSDRSWSFGMLPILEKAWLYWTTDQYRCPPLFISLQIQGLLLSVATPAHQFNFFAPWLVCVFAVFLLFHSPFSLPV